MSKNKQRMYLDLTVTSIDGVIIPIELTIDYPQDQGFYVGKAIEQLAKQSGAIYQEMVSRNDLTTLNELAKVQSAIDKEKEDELFNEME